MATCPRKAALNDPAASNREQFTFEREMLMFFGQLAGCQSHREMSTPIIAQNKTDATTTPSASRCSGAACP